MITTASKIEFLLRPLADCDRRTTYQFSIAIDGEAVWPVRGEPAVTLEIQVDDLLAYLTEFWKPLLLRQVYPIPVEPVRPSDLRRCAESRWTGLPPPMVEKEDELVSSFEEAHNLGLAFGGQYGLPDFWIMRCADLMVIESADTVWRMPFQRVRDHLITVGNEISNTLVKADPAHWDAAITAWRYRDSSDPVSLLAWSVGVDKKLADALIADGNLRPPRDFDDAANDNDELRIAARIAGALSPGQIRDILSLARQFKNHDADKLRTLARECKAYIAEPLARKPPFTQGEAAALFCREKLGIPDDAPVNIFEMMDDLAITVHCNSVEPRTFDGLAIWGREHGPGVFINQASQRVVERPVENPKFNSGARVTLAHELCHILLDGTHALSAIDILKARMPAGVEARARSFAGELLLPGQTAAHAWQRANRPRDFDSLKALVGELSEFFGVTWSVATWKLQHGAGVFGADLEHVLDDIVPYR